MYWGAGYQIHIHINGDAGMDVLVCSLKKAMQRTPRKDHRTVLVRFCFSAPERVLRWAIRGGIVCANHYACRLLHEARRRLRVVDEHGAPWGHRKAGYVAFLLGLLPFLRFYRSAQEGRS
jgi:hypothetical protein